MKDEQKQQLLSSVKAILEMRGIDTEKVERRALENGRIRRQFSTPLAPGVSSKFESIPEGNEESRSTANGAKAPRCQARSRHSGWKQCNAIAKKGFRVCIRHGASAHGSKTPDGVERSAAHLLVTGNERRSVRKRRSHMKLEMKLLHTQMLAAGLSEPISRRNPNTSKAKYEARRKQTVKAARARARASLTEIQSR